MEGAMIYGLCLERLKHQITKARERAGLNTTGGSGVILLESYRTGEPEEIVYILELYDLNDVTSSEVYGKLEELAFTVSELLRERLAFANTAEGHLGLYLVVNEEAPVKYHHEVLMAGSR